MSCALSITEDKLRKKRVIFRGKDGATVSSSSGDEMNQSTLLVFIDFCPV